MPRVLLHYDIHDSQFRTTVELTITNPQFVPRFQKVTESVYAALCRTSPNEILSLVTRLRATFANAPAGTRIILETPLDTQSGLDVFPNEIANT